MRKKFNFASFSFPRYIPQIVKRDKKGKTLQCVYITAPTPITGGDHPGNSFYLNDMGSPSRWKLAHDVNSRIRHTGWHCDEYGDQTITGLVVLLSHGKYLAGWTMGEGMISCVEGCIYTDEMEAANAADDIARYAAEKEREYQGDRDDD